MPMSADELLLFRRKRKMTQANMASALGVSRMTINNWERERFAIPKDIVERIAALDAPDQRAAPAQHRKDVEQQLAWYRAYRNGLQLSHAATMAKAPRALDPATVAILATEYFDFTQGE